MRLWYTRPAEVWVAALPSAWPSGQVRGPCARGGFEVDIEWEKGRLLAATNRSRLGGSRIVRYGERVVSLETDAGRAYLLADEFAL